MSAKEKVSVEETLKLKRVDYPHLSDLEWEALGRLITRIGTTAVHSILTILSAEKQKNTIFEALNAEQLELSREVSRGRAPTLKVDISKYSGDPKESVLRWFVELDAAITARGIRSDDLKITFAASNLSGRAKKWAYGRMQANPLTFETLDEFKTLLRECFEPPKNEFRARVEFLSLKQGKRDLHTYCTRARELIACVVSDPIDMKTQVTVFMAGLADGPVRTQLFREYPESLEKAISRAMEEDFSVKQAKTHQPPTGPRRSPSTPSGPSGPEPMDLSYIDPTQQKKPPVDMSKIVCRRCQQKGHYASHCPAPTPVPRESSRGGRGGGRGGRGGRSKNT